MAEAWPFLLELRGLALDQINQLIEGKEVAQWIKYELDTLIPQLERIEGARTEVDGEFRDTIRRAEDLVETYTKTEIQMEAATFKTPIYAFRIMKISKQLHHIKRKISSRTTSPPPEAAGTIEQHAVLSYLKRYQRYLLMFPPDIPVPSRRLIALWVAEGLVHPKKHESAEQIAERYLNELIDERLLLCTSRNRSGRVKSCTIDADSWNALMQDASDFLKDRDGNIRRLIDGINGDSSAGSFIQVYGNDGTVSHPVQDYRSVISFLSLNTQEGNKPGEEIGGFLRLCISARCFVWLRVLDLERVFRPKLPDTLGKVITLKYLGLRWTYLEILPDSVDKLIGLQVLDVKHTYISVLPTSIWRMQYLRHLYLSEAYRTRFPNPPSKVTLTALQTLWGAFVDEDTPVERGLSKLLNLRKLGLSCRSRASSKLDHMSQVDKWISKLEFLETLRLKSRNEKNEAIELRLTSLEGNRKLSVVYLLGKLDSRVLCRLPASLTDVTLSGSKLNLDPLEFLGRLPNLMILRLLGESVVCSKMRCGGRGFRQLKVLWIWKLEKLEELEAEEGSLPCLEELEIRSCKNLKALPPQLGHVLKNLGISGNLSNFFESGFLEKLMKLEKLKLVNSEAHNQNLLNSLPGRNCFPPNIKRLTLTKTSLGWQHMSTVAMIKSLETLKLKDYAFVGEKWNLDLDTFPSLRLLLIHNADLVLWEANPRAFPRLKFLVVKNCDNLEEIPHCVGTNLEELEIDGVRFSLVQSAEKIKESKMDSRTGRISVPFKLTLGPSCKKE